ncbi:MAG: A24 family peptidase [Acetobacter sp.]|nr:A24 family peptidase [Acetobacter sp.]
MTYIIIGFIFGFSIPYLARRFSKFMPATFAYALYRIFSINKTVSKTKRQANHKYQQLIRKYFMRSLGWGIITAATSFLASQILIPTETPWIVFFIITLFILMEIDKRMLLLPDLLTIPLLIGGFTYAAFAGELLGYNTIDATQNSALGAIFGYFIPVIASLFLIKKHPDVFGGGDIKLLSAVGAWLGFVNIPVVILLSCAIFAISCFVNKQRQGAFGPSIVLASLIMLFLLEY